MSARGLIIAAPHSGAGKTTVTLAVLAALMRRGVAVRAAKAGPDYIDPAFHTAATGAPSVNLNSWAMPASLLDALAAQAAQAADIFVIEGVMGLFDGASTAPGQRGATADLAAHFSLPVVLVLDVSRQAQSAAAVVRGFATHDPAVRIAGVILNRVASERHCCVCRFSYCDARYSGFRRRAARGGIDAAGASPRSGPGWRTSRSDGADRAARGHGGTASRPQRHRCQRRAACDRDNTTSRDAGAAAGPAHRAGARSGVQLRLSAFARGVAQSRRRDHSVLAARRRGATRARRQLLAAGRLSGAARRQRSPRHGGFPRDCGTSPKRGRCTANAAATWCSARALRTQQASGTP